MTEKYENNEVEILDTENESGEYNASFDPDPLPDMSEEELQDTILADSNMTAFQRFIAKLDDQKWNLYQRILGVVLGIGACVALFWNTGKGEDESAFTWTLVIAIVIAMLIPNIIEKQGARRIPKLRMALVIALAVMVAGYFVYWGLVHNFQLTANEHRQNTP